MALAFVLLCLVTNYHFTMGTISFLFPVPRFLMKLASCLVLEIHACRFVSPTSGYIVKEKQAHWV